MSDLGSTRVSKPKQSPQSIIQAGLKAHQAVIKYRPTVEPRLPPSTILELADDLQNVGAAIPAPAQSHAEAEVALTKQRDLLSGAFTVIGNIRDLVRAASVPAEVRKAYGIGRTVNRNVPKQILAVLGLIQTRAADHPTEPATLGITQADLDAVTKAITEINDAFNTQQKKRAAAPLSTKQRNRILNRILRACTLIAAAGAAAFRASPEIAKEFAEVAPPPGPKKKKTAKKAGAKKAAAKKAAANADAPKPATTPAASATPAADPAKPSPAPAPPPAADPATEPPLSPEG
jgi:hypothetical protein